MKGEQLLERARFTKTWKVAEHPDDPDLLPMLHLYRGGREIITVGIVGDHQVEVPRLGNTLWTLAPTEVGYTADSYALDCPKDEAPADIVRGQLGRMFADGDPRVTEALHVVCAKRGQRAIASWTLPYVRSGQELAWGEPRAFPEGMVGFVPAVLTSILDWPYEGVREVERLGVERFDLHPHEARLHIDLACLRVLASAGHLLLWAGSEGGADDLIAEDSLRSAGLHYERVGW